MRRNGNTYVSCGVPGAIRIWRGLLVARRSLVIDFSSHHARSSGGSDTARVRDWLALSGEGSSELFALNRTVATGRVLPTVLWRDLARIHGATRRRGSSRDDVSRDAAVEGCAYAEPANRDLWEREDFPSPLPSSPCRIARRR